MLSALILVPIIIGGIIGFWPGDITAKIARKIALVVTGGLLIWSLVLMFQFNPGDDGLQFRESWVWIKAIGLTYNLGIDGISMPLLVLNGLLTAIALYSTDESIERPRFYYALVLLLNGGVAGAFLAQDLLLFFLFYEIELIPLYLLIAIWGGQRRGYAATKFLLYTAISGILILASFLGLVFLSGSANFAYPEARNMSSLLPLGRQLLLLGGIIIGFGIKIPLVPFHTWLPDAHVEASTPISILLAGILLKLGTYGLLRFGVELFPEAWTYLGSGLAIWAVVSVIYGALNAICQRDMKKMVAFSSVAHMGYILLALAAATPLSLVSSVLQMVSHGLISGLLFFLVGIVYKKTGSRDLDTLNGLFNRERGLPLIGSLMVVGVMASAGIPGMVGFISEFLIFRGSLPVFPVQTILCMIGTGLTAVYFLILLDRAFFGRLSAKVINLPPVNWAERTPGIILAILIVILGVQPGWLLHLSETTTAAIFIGH
ncbi:MAG TPA: NADH-quinone oxidoreductase subunit M [Cyanobacteria bacterium UBA11149]|nr:NADH-quinone oxidoreductase subunit M [Cyanobacteria bacterium UBA11367]HBE56249.1 NADH-quinone oxidoreductase subunit M [Cyanobacteria bacterium UBA11366]HBK64638.1 NADH-quinone oxidoreductase subunit M [Cyanobacteria bacterium UBA11166]HBR76202.1 NADH-quinone oxidoreductase subunit M [Cyanobacteria bacterium UBA11159]HBS68136.1 NADH-quinone oxidoreductase subunit M [Cyanobacteria bacterium UBA11153]HBW90998.1 NADH-quinone oxidoreductase subunit M [Cyanobacteria bacterium UBA11149]HCA9528